MKKKIVVNILKYTIILLIFFFIFKYLYSNLNSVNLRDIKFNYIYLCFSVLIYLVHIICNSVIWYFITRQNGCSIGFFETLKIRIYSDFGKYIPGKVFAYGILFYNYDVKGISKKKIGICSFQELVAGTLAAIIIALVSIYFSGIEVLSKYNPIFILFAIVCLIVIYPGILRFFANKFLILFKREPITISSSYLQILLILSLFIINWLIFGIGFYFFINSFYNYSLSGYLFTTGAFAIAGLIGFVAIFAPAGLGVREGVLVFTLSFIFPGAIAAIISLISRIWMTICELIVLSVVYCFSLIKKKSSN